MRSPISTVVAAVLLTVAAQGRAQQLNNLVNQVLNITTTPATSHNFNNAREGWINIRVPAPTDLSNGVPFAVVDGKTVALKKVGNYLEAMHYVGQGTHAIVINGNGATLVNRLQVRAVGDLTYAQYGMNPDVVETGKYTWNYLRSNGILDSYNGMVGLANVDANGKSPHEAEITEWTNEGKRWYSLNPAPFAARTADEAFDYLTHTIGMSHPKMSGMWSDEYGVGMKEGMLMEDRYPFLNEALNRLKADPQYSDRLFYAYGPNQLWPEEYYAPMYSFIQTLQANNYRFAVEWYLVEERTGPGRTINNQDDLYQKVFSPGWEGRTTDSWEAASPGSSKNRVVALGLLSQPEESLDIFPDTNFNVFLDVAFQFIATNSSHQGVRGVQGYLSQYAGEEQTRLFADLTRHYFIEGRTDLMLKNQYVLTHLTNPDFDNGTTGWTVQPANGSASLTTKSAPGFGFLQGRFHAPAGLGDVGLWTKRNAGQANIVSQTVKDLIPGRLYSLHFFTGDYQDLINGVSQQKLHGVSVDISNADILDELSFQARNKSNYGHVYGPYNINHPYWMNYHQKVFKALDETALLRLSDWASAGAAGGPAGQELIWNFFQLQPYYKSYGYKILDDDFENRNSGQLPVAQVGTRYAGNGQVRSTLPGAPTVGSKYLLIDRASSISDNVWYDLDAEPIGKGNSLHFEFFMNVLGGVAAFGMTTSSTQNAAYTSNGVMMLAVLEDGSVQAYANGAYHDTGLDAVKNKWQLWQIDYIVGSSTFTLSVGGDTIVLTGANFLFNTSADQVNSIFFNTGNSATRYLLDDLLVTLAVPEPGAALLLLGGVVPMLMRRSRS